MFWLSRRSRNDLFLLYAFADLGRPNAELRAAILARSARIPDLSVRLREVPGDLAYPSWVPCEVADDQFVEHHGVADWAGLRSAVGELLGTGVDATHRPWRLHVFRGVTGAPMRRAPEETTTVAVLQLSHALVDGRRATALARELFGGATEPGCTASPPTETDRHEPIADSAGTARTVVFPDRLIAAVGALLLPANIVRTTCRGFRAYRAREELAALTAAGTVPPPGPLVPPTAVNDGSAPPVSRNAVEMLVFDSGELRVPGRTVTVVVLTALSVALPKYLAARGEPVAELGAQVPMAMPSQGKSTARNNYRNLSIELFLDEPDLSARADRIAAALGARRERARHPLLSAQDRVTAVTPALFLRRDADRWALDAVPESIAGNTVVSSVDRGPADLDFGGPVRFTAGFPAVGSVMRLTHGVHGLGDTVTVSIHADPVVVPDLDTYAENLRDAVSEVVTALR